MSEDIIYAQERLMWEAARGRDKAAFSQLVASEAVMVCGGYRCSGAEYAEVIGEFGISEYEISDFETVLKTPEAVQVHYMIRITEDRPENADLAGLFHVTSTWKNDNGRWQLVFNMDQRIVEIPGEEQSIGE